MTELPDPEPSAGPSGGPGAAAWQEADAVARAAVEIESQRGPRPGAMLRQMVAVYGERGLLRWVAPHEDEGDVSMTAVARIRERLGYASPLAELAFAMQGLGSYPLTYGKQAHGTAAPFERWLPEVVAGRAVAAFALTEPGAGTDLGGIATTARRDGDDWLLDGHKIFISNAGVADVYAVFARTSDGPKPRLTAFALPAKTDGVETRAQHVLGGHPIGELHLSEVRLPDEARIGEVGRGLSVALATLHRFRPTVGAAAVGFAWRALDESLAHVKRREQFGAPLSELQLVQARLAEMACDVDASRLLVRRAVRAIDEGEPREVVARYGSMAKLVATEAAQRVIDHAVQLHGGRGVSRSAMVARLYEDVRALRIYEGASDVQKILIARSLLESSSK